MKTRVDKYGREHGLNMFHHLTAKEQQEMYSSILDIMSSIIGKRSPKSPLRDFLEEAIAEDLHRLIASLDSCLYLPSRRRKYLLFYKGSHGRKEYSVIETEARHLVDLKKEMETCKPSWALEGRAIPLAVAIPDDYQFPMVMYWPKLKKPSHRRVGVQQDGNIRPEHIRRGTFKFFDEDI